MPSGFKHLCPWDSLTLSYPVSVLPCILAFSYDTPVYLDLCSSLNCLYHTTKFVIRQYVFRNYTYEISNYFSTSVLNYYEKRDTITPIEWERSMLYDQV